MIKIEKEKDITFVNSSVTEFADALGYCQYKIPLSIKGVKPRPTASLILGTKAHHAEERYEKEHVKLEPVYVEQIEDEEVDVEFARENVYSTLSMPYEFPTENVLVTLSGRIDKIMRVDGTLVVQDDKFVGRPQSYEQKTQPYPSQLLQVLVYLNSVYSGKRKNNPEDWFDLPHTKKRWELRICDRKTRQPYKIYSEYQDAFSLYYLHSSLEKFTTITLGIAKPEHHNSQSKCEACNLKKFCEYKI